MDVAMSSASTAHVYGNVASFVSEYIQSLFPKYFNTVHVSSSIVYRDFARFNNKKMAMIKKSKPILIVRPRVEINPNDTFLNGTALTGNHTNEFMNRGYSNLQPFIRNDRTKTEVRYLLNRLKMYFDITIIVETQMEQINMANYLRNRICQDRPFFVKTHLESHIPRGILEAYSMECGIPMYDANGSVQTFLEHLNGVSMFPITYKIKNSTGNDEFFKYYQANLLMAINDLSIDDGNKKGMTYDSFTINFSIPVEFNAAGLYYYFTNNRDRFADIRNRIEEGFYGDQYIVPMFTVSNLYDIPIEEGWSMYGSFVFKTDVDKGYPDSVDLTAIYNESMLEFLSHHRSNGIPTVPFLRFYLMKNNNMEKMGEDFDIIDNGQKLVIPHADPKASYRVIIHADTRYINELMKRIHNLEED